MARLPGELVPLTRFSAGQSDRYLAGTPAEGLTCPPEPPPLSRRQWGNVGLVVLFVQGLRVLFAAALIGGFFVAFGILTMRLEVIETWIQATPDVVGTVTVLGREVAVTADLLKVAAFLAGFSGMYFAVYLVTDPAFRADFFDDITDEIRQAMAVRGAYLDALEDRDAG